MVSFLKKLFGAGNSGASTEVMRGEPVAYNGYQIQPAPQSEGSQWRLAGYIRRGQDDSYEETMFVRADLFSSREEALEFAVRKGRQIVDEQGDRLFADRSTPGSS